MISITRLLLGLDSMPGSGFLCAVSSSSSFHSAAVAWELLAGGGEREAHLCLFYFLDENHRG